MKPHCKHCCASHWNIYHRMCYIRSYFRLIVVGHIDSGGGTAMIMLVYMAMFVWPIVGICRRVFLSRLIKNEIFRARSWFMFSLMLLRQKSVKYPISDWINNTHTHTRTAHTRTVDVFLAVKNVERKRDEYIEFGIFVPFPLIFDLNVVAHIIVVMVLCHAFQHTYTCSVHFYFQYECYFGFWFFFHWFYLAFFSWWSCLISAPQLHSMFVSFSLSLSLSSYHILFQIIRFDVKLYEFSVPHVYIPNFIIIFHPCLVRRKMICRNHLINICICLWFHSMQ